MTSSFEIYNGRIKIKYKYENIKWKNKNRIRNCKILGK